MVVESILEAVLSKHLDKWFYGITRENIKAEVLKGRFVISNIGLRESIFINSNMPYDLRHSYVQKIQLNINWTSNERVVSISINKIYALLSIKEEYDPDAVLLHLKKSAIRDHISKIINKKDQPEEEREAGKNDGGISAFLKKLLDNVNISIKSIHLRFEDEVKRYSFGLRVYQIEIINVDQRENPQFFNREKSEQNYINYGLTIDPLQIYFNPEQSLFLCSKDYAEITNEMISMDNHRQNEAHIFNGTSMWGRARFTYILTISVKGLLKRYIRRESIDTPQYECSITFKSIELSISDLQFQVLLSIINEVSRYQEMMQGYSTRVEIVPRKEREGSEIISFLHMRSNKKERRVIGDMARAHLIWVFKQTHNQILKKRFVETVCRSSKPITVQSLFQSRTLEHIIRRVQIYKLKQWIAICFEIKKKQNQHKSLFFSAKQAEKAATFQRFYQEQIEKLQIEKQKQLIEKQRRQKKKDKQFYYFVEQKQQIEREIVLRLSVRINQLGVKISKDNLFGLRVLTQNTSFDILKRRNNFKLVFAVKDLVADVFKLGLGQKYPTYVPILKKNVQLNRKGKRQNLIKLQFEKSPIGKPFVFSESKINFQSIEITIYAEVFSNLYQIFFKPPKSEQKAKPPAIKKKKTNIKAQEQEAKFIGASFQQNIIQGFIESPWIVVPLSRTNDTSKDCWVVRLGDLFIETPPIQSSSKMDQRIFYERFFIELKSFQLKYFSSIDYFYIWLQYQNSLKSLKSLPGFQNSKHIDIISPISCQVDLSVLKSHVSSIVRRTKEAFSARIKIQKVHICLPKLLLDKLKQKVDVFGDEKRNQDFIETNVKNVIDEGIVEGVVTISNQKFKQITLYAILKGHFIYFFFKDSLEEILFTTDVRDTTIRLTSDHHTFINEGKPKKLKIQLKEKQKHGLWKKHLNQLLTKRDRMNDRTFSQIMSQKTISEETMMKNTEEVWKNTKKKSNNQFQKPLDHKKSLNENNLGQTRRIPKQESTLLNLFFLMESLSIQLIDEKEEQFLFCLFQKTKFNYSNVEQKMITFSILQWKILQKQSTKSNAQTNRNQTGKKKDIPFLSSKRLIKEKERAKEEQHKDERKEQQDESNFLEVAAMYSQLTEQLNEISIKVDQLYISWNIHIFNKILKFFFYSAQMADTPTVPTTKKSPLVVKFNMHKFYLYCFHDLQLIALLKLSSITINYSQNEIEQRYIVNCERFQMDKYEDNDENRQVPMIICPHKLETLKRNMKSIRSFELENDSVKLEDSVKPARRSQLLGSTNPMFLSYVVRKEETRQFQNIQKLKSQFGKDLLVSEVKCTWSNFVIYFDQEQTIRLINYFIGTILGTVAAKFKKKQYSINYISETLKIKKMTTFDISLTNFTAIMTPHSRTDHYFQAKVQKINFTKNINDSEQYFKPKQIKVPTKRDQVSLFYETMVFDIANVSTFYHYGLNPPQKLARNSLNAKVTYSKLNFSRQYEPILNMLSDIDRTVTIKVKIQPGFQLQFQKIIFLTLLQIFYQNIKNRDGKAQKFETPHPQPALKVYQIDLGTVDLYMYEYIKNDEATASDSKQLGDQILHQQQGINSEKRRKIFEHIHAGSIRLVYQNQGPNSQIQMNFGQIHATGLLPVQSNNPYISSSLTLKMNSVEGETFLKLVPDNLKIHVNLDNLNQVIEFTNYDSDYVSNKIMPKKKKDSYMTVNVFPERCCAQVGELELFGDFYITYTKDFKNPVSKAAQKFLFQHLSEQKLKGLDSSYIKDQISDKEIKVNGQNVAVFINKKHIGVLKRLFFGRVEHASKEAGKRFRKQHVVIDGLSAMANILQLSQLYKTYESHIKKAKDYEDKIFLLPFQNVTTKPKSIQKREMQVQLQRSYLNIMRMLPEKNQQNITPFMSYMTIQFMIPKICYSTYLKQQLISITDLTLKVLQYGGNLDNNKILEFVGLRLRYKEDKAEHTKFLEIQNAKNIKVAMKNMNEKLFALLAKEVTSLGSLKAIEKTRNSERKIFTQSMIQKSLISQREMSPDSESIVRIEQDEVISAEQFYLLLANSSSRNIHIIINNFQLDSTDGGSKEIRLQSKEAKILRYSGIKMLQFLDQSAKQKNVITELGFRNDSSGPIIVKTMKQILCSSEVELFSWCSIKYQAVPNGIKLQIFEPYSVINLTYKPLHICMLDRKKKPINRWWVPVEAGCEANLSNVESMPYYLIVIDTGASGRGDGEVNVANHQLIEIGDLPTNFTPNKIGPLWAYPSALLQIMRWETETSSSRLKIVIFNRFRIQNNLPVSVQANFTTVQSFREGIIEGNAGANRSSMALKVRIDGKNEIQCDLNQACSSLASYMNQHKSKPKKKETGLTYHKIPAGGTREHVYQVMSWFRVGYLPKNMSNQQLDSNYVSPAAVENNRKISFTIENFIFLNQIVLCLACHRTLKDATTPSIEAKLALNWSDGPTYGPLPAQDNCAWMLPQPIDGLNFKIADSKSKIKSHNVRLQDISQKQSKIIAGRYLVSSFSRKISDDAETLYIVEDLCSIENKTDHIIEALLTNGEQNLPKSTLFPKTKSNLEIQQVNSRSIGHYLQLTAFCKSVKGAGDHLACTTYIELDEFKKNASEEQKGSSIQILYWSLNSNTSAMTKQRSRYETDLLKVTKKLIAQGGVLKYQLTLQSYKEQKDKSKVRPNFGYKFANNLPPNYAIIVRELKGIAPQPRSITKEYQKYYQSVEEDDEMFIPFEIDDELESLQMSHKKLSANSNKPDLVNEADRKEGKGVNQIEISRHNNMNSSRAKLVEYTVYPDKQITIGLTNLREIGNRSRMFTIEIYKINCNMEFQQAFEVKVDQPQANNKQIIIKEDQSRNQIVQFQGESESYGSAKSGKRTLQVISKKVSHDSSRLKFKEYKIKLLSHKKTDSALEFYVQSEDLLAQNPRTSEPVDYPRSLEVRILQVSLTVEVTNNPNDTLTLELQNLSVKQSQLPPASHFQKLSISANKFLIKAGKSSPIVQMLHSERQFLSVQAEIEKTGMGTRVDHLALNLQPIEFNVQEGIMFKILSRVVELRNKYFFYGKKLDQSLNVENNQEPSLLRRESQRSIMPANRKFDSPKLKSKVQQKFLSTREAQVKKQIKKLVPKTVLLQNLRVAETRIYFSFSKDDYAENKQQFVHDPIIKYFILIPAVSELKISIPSIQIKDFWGTEQELGKLVMKKIKHNIGGTLISSLSSLSVLDSPVAAIDGVFQYLEAIMMINST